MNELISVIVPVYNVEKYLRRCVESVLAQTYQNLEVILVDDGSTDQSGAICDEATKSDSRIIVIHQKNAGLSAARNTGIRAAQGELICFLDSDDWIEADTIQKAFEASNDTDMVIWGYHADFVDSEEALSNTNMHIAEGLCSQESNSVLNSQTAMGLIGYAWNKLYKSALIEGCAFPEGVSLVEDILFNAKIICQCKSIRFIPIAGTHYIQRPRTTLGNKFYPDYFELKIAACHAREKILRHFGFTNTECQHTLSSSYLAAINGQIRNIERSEELTNRQKRVQTRAFLRSNQVAMILSETSPSTKKEYITYYLAKLRFARTLRYLLKR